MNSLRCTLCTIIEKAQHALDYPHNGVTATDCLKEIVKLASAAIILDVLDVPKPLCQDQCDTNK